MSYKEQLIKLLKTPKIWIALAVLILLGAGWYFKAWTLVERFLPQKKSEQQRTVTVDRGDITVKISGSGVVAPIEKYDITPLVKGNILKAPFEEGQMVKKDDLLYSIDQQDVLDNIKKLETSVQKTALTDQTNKSVFNDLVVKAGANGKITNITLKEGDSFSSNGGKVADIYDDSTMILRVPFNAQDAIGLNVGQRAQVSIPDLMSIVSGRVKYIQGSQKSKDAGAVVCDVEIEVQNPGGIQKGTKASATIATDMGEIACNSLGSFEYSYEQALNSQGGGRVQRIYVKNGDAVSAGQTIITFTNDTAVTNSIKSGMDLKDAQLTLEMKKNELKQYNINSPINGKIISKSYKKDDTIDNTSAKAVLAVVADVSKMTFEVNVDELDILKVKPGQRADVTADAVPNKKFIGIVDRVGLQGKSTNGVTTYPVKVIISEPGELMPNMNVNADIIVESKTNVLRAAISAVRRGSYVFVKTDAKNGASTGAPAVTGGAGRFSNMTDEQRQKFREQMQANRPSGAPSVSGAPGNVGRQRASGQSPQASGVPRPTGAVGSAVSSAPSDGTTGRANRAASADFLKNIQVPQGYELRLVQTGANTQDYIEIIGGLKEGDVLLLPEVKTTTATTPAQQQGFGVPGAGGGGFTGGGGFSGGGNTRTTTGR